MSKTKIKLTDSQKSTNKGIIWDKTRGVWHYQKKLRSGLRIYGGINASTLAYKPFKAWFFINANEGTAQGNFKTIEDAMAFVEKYFDKDFYI